MFRSAKDAAAEESVPGLAHDGGTLAKAIGAIRTLNGSANIIRSSDSTVPIYVGISVFRGDVVVTGDDSAVEVTFEDGSVFCLGVRTRMVLDEFISDRDGTLNSALFRVLQGTFKFITGKTTRPDQLSISTPLATIRGAARSGGMGVLTFSALTFAIIKEAQAASQKSAFLDDDRFTYEHLEAGTIEITTKEPVPRTITVNNPALTVVIRPAGTGGTYNVEQATNSAARMAELQDAYKSVATLYSQGQNDTFIQQHRRADLDGEKTGIIRQVGAQGSEGVFAFADLPTTVTQGNANSGKAPSSDSSDPLLLPPVVAPIVVNQPQPLTVSIGGSVTLNEIIGVTGSPIVDTAQGSLAFSSRGGGLSVSANLISTAWSAGNSLPGGLVATLAGALTTTTVSPNSTDEGSVDYEFGVADHTFDFLANGETLAVLYNLSISNGTTTSIIPVTIIVAGTNDGPTLTSATTVGTVVEDVLATSASGAIAFADADFSDTHTVSVVPAHTGYLGNFAASIANGSAGGGTGQVTWNFNADLQFLAEGQTLTQTYTVTIEDGEGGTLSRDVTLTITGSNDAPIITAHDDGAVESIDASAGNLTDSGTVSFADVDLSDVHTASVTFVSSTFGPQLGSLTAGPSVDTDTTGSGSSGSVAWNFAVTNSAVHALAHGQTITETYAISISDGQGGTATQVINVAMTDDDPPTVSISDVSVNEDAGTITFTVTKSGATAVGATVGYAVTPDTAGTPSDYTVGTSPLTGTLSFAAGETTKTITLNVTNDTILELTERFNVDLSSPTNATILDGHGVGTIIDNDPAAGAPITLEVDEAALSTAGATGSNPSLTTEVDNTPTLSFTAAGFNLVSFAFSNDISGLVTDLNGDASQDIFWVRDLGTQISGYLDGAHTLLADRLTLSGLGTIAAGTTGSVTVTETLSDNLKHLTANGAQVSSLGDVGVVATDTNGNTATGTVNLTVKDDTPKADLVAQSVVATAAKTNVMVILDLSGSMNTGATEFTVLSRLDVAKAAINELLEQYDNRGDVMVRIVTFADNGAEVGSVWMTVDQAKAAVAALETRDSTNYDAALLTAMGAFTDAGKLTGAGVQNVSYFLSDGDPTANTDWPATVDGPLPGLDPVLTQNGIQPTEQLAWESFLATNNIISFALGIPAVATPTNLNPIAFDPASGTQLADTPIIVTDLSQLASTLVFSMPPVNGGFVAGVNGGIVGSFGADGGFMQSITVDSIVYTFNPTANGGLGGIATSGGGTFTYNGATKTLTVDTDPSATGGELAIVMTTGAFTFQPTVGFTSESVGYVLTDGDGDTASNTLMFAAPGAADQALINSALDGNNGNVSATDVVLVAFTDLL